MEQTLDKLKDYLRDISDDKLATLYKELLLLEEMPEIPVAKLTEYTLAEIGRRFLEENG